MLSVAKLTPGQERYYERSVAAGLDDYYAGRGESPGVWIGRGAATLGLEGGDGATRRSGRSPSSGSTRRPTSVASSTRSCRRSPATTSPSRRRRASASC